MLSMALQQCNEDSLIDLLMVYDTCKCNEFVS